MKRLKGEIASIIDEMAPTSSAAKITFRANQVHERFKSIIEYIYKGNAPFLLSHINSVYITCEKNKATYKDEIALIIYCDDAMVRTDILSKQHQILLLFKQNYGEDLDRFKSFSSRGNMRKRHPYLEEDKNHQKPAIKRSLTDDEKRQILLWGREIEDSDLRKAFLKAASNATQYKSPE